jgi:hypothetical protein
MQCLEVSGAVRPLKWPLGVKWLRTVLTCCVRNAMQYFRTALPKRLLSVVKPVGQVLNAKTYYQQNNDDGLLLKQGWAKCGTADHVTYVTL